MSNELDEIYARPSKETIEEEEKVPLKNPCFMCGKEEGAVEREKGYFYGKECLELLNQLKH